MGTEPVALIPLSSAFAVRPLVTSRSADLDPATGGFGIGGVSSFGEDARGEVYIVDYGTGGFDGEIFKIVPGA